MKKVLIGVGMALQMTSCGSAADRVNIEKMERACDCASGFMILAEDVLEEIGNKTTNDLRNDRELVEKIQLKIDKIEQLEQKCHRELKITMEELEACDEGLKDLAKKFEERF